MFNTADHEFMARALHLAERGLYTTDPNPRVGCVIVGDGVVLGEAWHQRAGEPHAEVLALRQAGAAARGATLYVTLEPCAHHGRTPPCADALVDAGLGRVVVAMEDPNPRVAGQGLARLREAGIAVDSGLMAEGAAVLNPGFVKRMRESRPFVRCKMAMSLDGRTAMASGESRWITGDAARRDVHRLRARSSAIVTGIGTVLADDPGMTVRLEQPDEEAWRQPLRVVLDPWLSIPASARILAQPGRTVVLTAEDNEALHRPLLDAGAEIQVVGGHAGSLDLQQVMDYLAAEEMNEVLLETGATLSGAMLRAGFIDELVVYMAPHLMGNEARGLFVLPGLEQMTQRLALEIRDMRAVGEDWRITASVNKRG